MNDERSLAVFTLAIYDLIIIPRVFEYIEVAVIDFFEQVQNHSNHRFLPLSPTKEYCDSELARRNRSLPFLIISAEILLLETCNSCCSHSTFLDK